MIELKKQISHKLLLLFYISYTVLIDCIPTKQSTEDNPIASRKTFLSLLMSLADSSSSSTSCTDYTPQYNVKSKEIANSSADNVRNPLTHNSFTNRKQTDVLTQLWDELASSNDNNKNTSTVDPEPTTSTQSSDVDTQLVKAKERLNPLLDRLKSHYNNMHDFVSWFRHSFSEYKDVAKYDISKLDNDTKKRLVPMITSAAKKFDKNTSEYKKKLKKLKENIHSGLIELINECERENVVVNKIPAIKLTKEISTYKLEDDDKTLKEVATESSNVHNDYVRRILETDISKEIRSFKEVDIDNTLEKVATDNNSESILINKDSNYKEVTNSNTLEGLANESISENKFKKYSQEKKVGYDNTCAEVIKKSKSEKKLSKKGIQDKEKTNSNPLVGLANESKSEKKLSKKDSQEKKVGYDNTCAEVIKKSKSEKKLSKKDIQDKEVPNSNPLVGLANESKSEKKLSKKDSQDKEKTNSNTLEHLANESNSENILFNERSQNKKVGYDNTCAGVINESGSENVIVDAVVGNSFSEISYDKDSDKDNRLEDFIAESNNEKTNAELIATVLTNKKNFYIENDLSSMEDSD